MVHFGLLLFLFVNSVHDVLFVVLQRMWSVDGILEQRLALRHGYTRILQLLVHELGSAVRQ